MKKELKELNKKETQMYVGQKMEEVRQLIKKVIELEYKNALNKGLLDSRSISNNSLDGFHFINAILIPSFLCSLNFQISNQNAKLNKML